MGKQLIESINVWRLAIVRMGIYAFIAVGSGYLTTMEGIKWNALDGDQKFKTCLGLAILFGNIVMAFLDRTIERISQGQSPIPGTTQFFQNKQEG